MSRRTSLDTTDFDASNGEMRLLQFSQDEEEEEGEEDSSSRRSRQQDILTGRTYLSSSLQFKEHHKILVKISMYYLLYLYVCNVLEVIGEQIWYTDSIPYVH